MSPELRQFLTEWLAWVEAGAPEHPKFSKRRGLCRAFDVWGNWSMELKLMFVDDPMPFNLETNSFWEECNTGQIHLNPKRIAWVRQQLGVANVPSTSAL